MRREGMIFLTIGTQMRFHLALHLWNLFMKKLLHQSKMVS